MRRAGPLAELLRARGLACVGLAQTSAASVPGLRLVVGSGGDLFAKQALDGLSGDPDPVDRLARVTAGEARSLLEARGLRATVLLPFEAGAPDFRALAQAAGLGVEGRLGLLMHPRLGAWWALRFAMALPADDEARLRQVLRQALAGMEVPGLSAPLDAVAAQHPCLRCVDAPCVAACPAAAVAAGEARSMCSSFAPRFRLARCLEHLRADGCVEGCAARAACPVGPAYEAAVHGHHHRFFREAVRSR